VGNSAHRPPARPSDRVIAELAVQQHGVVSLAQLVELGLHVGIVDKRVAAGRLHRVHHGVYAVGHPLLSQRGWLMAAALACGAEAVVSHRSAAALWGLRPDGRPSIDITAPGRRGRTPLGIDAHRHGSLRPQDRTFVDQVPCTTVARTLLDLAGVLGARELRNAITKAEVLRLFDLVALQEVIGRSRGRRGVARLRRAIAEHDSRDERARGELERRFLALCRRAELGRPEINAPLVIEGVQIEADFLWRQAGLIVETDGRRFHGTAAAFEQDRRRDRRLQVAGWRVLRCTWRQVVDAPEELARDIRLLLRPDD